MKILQILNTPHFSGAANYCITASRELIKRSHEVLIVTQPGRALEQIQKYPELRYDTSIRLNHRNPVLFAQAIKRFKLIYKSFKPDIISPNMSEAAWLPSLLARALLPSAKVVRIRTEYGPPKKYFTNQIIYKRLTDHMVVGSQRQLKESAEALNLASSSLSVVYGGIDSDKFSPSLRKTTNFRAKHGIDKNETLIGLLARLDPVKGHRYALQALTYLKNLKQPFRLVIIGYEAEYTYSRLRSLAYELGVADKLLCLGFVDDLPNVLGAIDIGLISSIGSEANSRAALELMAVGCPIAATTVGVIPELVLNSEQGFLFAPKKSAEMASALKKLILNPILRANMGKSARKKVIDNFSLSCFAKHLEAVYNNVLTGKKSR